MYLLIILAALFTSPVHIPIELAGNFGEPRPNHFHGGIDIKSGRERGIGIYAIEAGYVTRISVNNTGSGRALFIHHPNGYTSSYFHLSSFSPEIRSIVEQRLGRKLTTGKQPLVDEAIDIYLRPGQLRVSKGQFIARSGDSGSSQAPHLHLEVHDSKTGDMLDPLNFFKDIVKDTVPPQAHAFMAYPVKNAGTFCGTDIQQSIGFSGFNLNRKFWAWGKVGFGLWANDYTGVTYNCIGVYNTVLLCDGDTVFQSTMSRVPSLEQREINAWGDYEHYLRANVWYLRSFRPKGVMLPVIKTYSKYPEGIITFNQQRDYSFKYILTDAKGNQSQYTFTVEGRHQDITPATLKCQTRLVRCDRTWSWQSPSMQLIIPQHSLGIDKMITPTMRTAPAKALSPVYSFANYSCPLFRDALLRIRLTTPPTDVKQLAIYSDFRNGTIIPVKSYNKGWVTVGIRDLAAHYYVIEQKKTNKPGVK